MSDLFSVGPMSTDRPVNGARQIACGICASSLAPGARMTGGRYTFRCVGCCARLLLSAWDLPDLVEAHLAAMERFGAAPPRERILRLADRLRSGPWPAGSVRPSAPSQSGTAASP